MVQKNIIVHILCSMAKITKKYENIVPYGSVFYVINELSVQGRTGWQTTA